MDKTQLINRMDAFSQGRVMVVGDIAIDEMTVGETSRLSREAPVVILDHQQTDIILGAGGNAAHNLAALGANKVTMVGVAGKDYHCSLLLDAMDRDGVSADGMVQDDSRPTTVKTRISGHSRQSVKQQIVRIDRESRSPISGDAEAALIENIKALAPHHDALILSDYSISVVTDKVIQTCQALANEQNILFAVDSHRNLRQFAGAAIATPNLPEAEKNVGCSLVEQAQLEVQGHQLRQEARLKELLITRGSDGMSLFDAQGQVHHIPVFNRSEVFDVTGAGDTVIATLVLAMITGASTIEAAVLGNLAASLVVKKYGTAVTSAAELKDALHALDASLLGLESRNMAV